MLPESDEDIRRYVREMVFHLAGSAPESEEEGIPKGEQIGESQAAELWLQIEKRLGWSGEDGDGISDDEDTSSSGLETYVKGFIRVVFTVGAGRRNFDFPLQKCDRGDISPEGRADCGADAAG